MSRASGRSPTSSPTRRSGCSTSPPTLPARPGSRITAWSSTSASEPDKRSFTCTGISWADTPWGCPDELDRAARRRAKQAMVARDETRRDALRLILSSLRSAEKELQRPLHDDEELQVLQRERKRRLEAAEAFRGGGREEQALGEEQELAVLEEFMPAPLSEEELEEIIDDAIAEVGATSIRDLGRVMADVMPQVSGRADGSVVSQLVREKLA